MVKNLVKYRYIFEHGSDKLKKFGPKNNGRKGKLVELKKGPKIAFKETEETCL